MSNESKVNKHNILSNTCRGIFCNEIKITLCDNKIFLNNESTYIKESSDRLGRDNQGIVQAIKQKNM